MKTPFLSSQESNATKMWKPATMLFIAILSLSHIGDYNFSASRNLNFEASTLLAPSGYVGYALRVLQNEPPRKYDVVYGKKAQPRTLKGSMFAWTQIFICYFFVLASAGVVLWKLRKSI